MAKTRRAPVLHLLLAVLALAGALSAARAEFANPSGVAVIIGNRTYAGDIPAVDYAHRDADAFRRYVVDVLGFDPENVIDLRDATQAKMWSTFGSRTTPERSELWSYLEDEGSDVVVFYSGHGAPGLDDRRGYLLPVDADPNTAELNGYPIDLLYENLARLAEPKTARVYLDACFSGGSAGGGMLIEGASPVFVEAARVVGPQGEAWAVHPPPSGCALRGRGRGFGRPSDGTRGEGVPRPPHDARGETDLEATSEGELRGQPGRGARACGRPGRVSGASVA